MSGTKIGAQRAKETMIKRFGEDYFANIGSKGGRKGSADGTIKGFALMTPEKRREAGSRGGKISKRVKDK